MNKIVFEKDTVRARISTDKNGEQIFKSIIYHPMETGYRLDSKTGEKIPADYIESVQISVDGKKYIEMTLGENVSKNPFLTFTLTRPLIDDQKLQIGWIDNNNREIIYDCVIKFNQSGEFNYQGDDKGSKIYQQMPAAEPACKTKTQ